MPSSGEVIEGGQFSVLCIAMGSPAPAVTLYISGHPIRTETTRHMVTTIKNATKLMEDIACHADNGYGTPNLARRRIKIMTPPQVWDFAQQFYRLKEGQRFSAR